MRDVNLTQSVWKRAFQDTQEVIGSLIFWIIDILVSTIVGAISSNPSLGGGVLIGIVALVYLFSLARAPFRQRNEAWEELKKIQIAKQSIPIVINDFIEHGSRLRQSLFTSWDEVQSEQKSKELNTWAEKVKIYLNQNMPEYAAHFMNDGGLNSQAYSGSRIRSNLASFMDRRLQRLSETLLKINTADHKH